MERSYIIGSLATVTEAMPGDVDLDHVRRSLDGQMVVVDAELTEDQKWNLVEIGLEVLTHEQALNVLNAPEAAGVWYTPEEPADA